MNVLEFNFSKELEFLKEKIEMLSFKSEIKDYSEKVAFLENSLSDVLKIKDKVFSKLFKIFDTSQINGLLCFIKACEENFSENMERSKKELVKGDNNNFPENYCKAEENLYWIISLQIWIIRQVTISVILR